MVFEIHGTVDYHKIMLKHPSLIAYLQTYLSRKPI